MMANTNSNASHITLDPMNNSMGRQATNSQVMPLAQ